MRYFPIFTLVILLGCGTGPGRLKTLRKNGIPYQSQNTSIKIQGVNSEKLSVQYTGCGGLYILKDGVGIMIDPYFSNQKLMRIGTSVLGRGSFGKRKLSSDPKMIDAGIKSLELQSGGLQNEVKAILSAHSHYDHLMDVPAVFERLKKQPTVYLNQSGYNTIYHVVDTNKMVKLENHMSTQDVRRPPIVIPTGNGKIHIYPILAEHNPHFKYIKFFSGSKTKPAADYTKVYGKTRANDWLEGNVFSFLIDYIDEAGSIDFRIFVQSSSCNPPAGIPPAELLKARPVDLAFLGLVSFHFSSEYPCSLIQAINPKEVVWIHWEDFFRKYTKEPKTVRGTDVTKFFELPCVSPYKSKALLPWPGVTYHINQN